MSIREYLETRYVKGVDTHPTRERVQGWATTLLVPSERRRAERIERSQSPLQLHIACGDTYLNGWVNIDLARPGRRLDLRWNLRRGLPFTNSVATAVFSEHFFEHLDLNSALKMMIECRRVLVPGGILRIAVPNFERYIDSYIGNDSIISEKRPESPTKLMAINEVVYFHGHRSMYDAETLKLLLIEAGFDTAIQSTFGESVIEPSPDSDGRQLESLYVEATA
jgi:predicted SAM-dependent methyltransferase